MRNIQFSCSMNNPSEKFYLFHIIDVESFKSLDVNIKKQCELEDFDAKSGQISFTSKIENCVKEFVFGSELNVEQKDLVIEKKDNNSNALYYTMRKNNGKCVSYLQG